MKIAILGAGAYGRALGKIVSNNGHDLDFYDPKICPDVSLEQATKNADAIIICIPSNFLPSFLEDYPAELKALPTFLASKGLGDVKIFKDFTNFAVLSGPTFAQEIMDGKQSMLTATNQLAVDIFANQQIEIEVCQDMQGVVLCGSLKNAYAIGAGFNSDSENAVAALLVKAHAEMKNYLLNHGANPDTAELACGIGDLILTCSSETSRNYTCGKKLHSGQNLDDILTELQTVEGINALHELEVTEEYPILLHIARLAGLKR